MVTVVGAAQTPAATCAAAGAVNWAAAWAVGGTEPGGAAQVARVCGGCHESPPVGRPLADCSASHWVAVLPLPLVETC